MAGLGRKLWTRETLSSADLQGYLQDQVVMRFASNAARAATIPNPTEGMLTTLDDSESVYRHDGTRWRKIAGPPLLLASVLSVGGFSQMANNGTFISAATVAVPAHEAGTLLCEFRGSWIAAANAACSWSLQYPAGTAVPGALARTANNGSVSVPVHVSLSGRVQSDGTARTLVAGASVDPGGVAINPNAGTWTVWLI